MYFISADGCCPVQEQNIEQYTQKENIKETFSVFDIVLVPPSPFVSNGQDLDDPPRAPPRQPLSSFA